MKIYQADSIETAKTDAQVFADNMAEQLRMAGMVQRDFLPSKLPDTDNITWATSFLPAECVSGDIYDIARVDERHIGFYIADVVGHGMPAALLTIFLKQALVMRQTIENNYNIFSPAEVMANLNLKMTAQKLSGQQFVTCCYCLLNTRTLQMTFARAGHPYPILLRPGLPPQQLESHGSLLGVFENAQYTQQTIQLQPGDKLFLYSDGVEQFIGNFKDQSGFHFAEDFCKIKDLPVAELTEKLKDAVKSRDIPLAEIDDITTVALEILQ